MRFSLRVTVAAALLLAIGALQGARVYPVRAGVQVREAPGGSARVCGELLFPHWVEVMGTGNGWTRVAVAGGGAAYVRSDLVTDRWLVVLKRERRLRLMRGAEMVEIFPVALGFNPRDDKVRLGDGCTPEGCFFLAEMIREPRQRSRYGARCMLLSYPGVEDARRGLAAGLVSRAGYLAIVRAVARGETPPQNTRLGSSIRIHGGGAGGDWTLGCVALADADIVRLFDQLPPRGARVEIFADAGRERALNEPGLLNRLVLAGARRQLQNPATYTRRAAAIVPISYPLGDIDAREAVCTDIVIRALRHAGIDLQALLHEDVLLYPDRYPAIRRANASIDHRRTRNLKVFFDHHARVETNQPPAQAPSAWQPGDIVLLDTGIANGTVYDHIGVVSDRRSNGVPLVINIWVTGQKTSEMDLLGGSYPAIVGHYRLTHPFDYDAIVPAG